jgi:hypothetical protein
MSEDIFERLKQEAKKAGKPGIGAYLLSKVGGLTNEAEAHSIVRLATGKATRWSKHKGPFILKKLFAPVEWDGFSKPARIAAGKEFYAAVDSGQVPGVRIGEKTPSNHQTYERDD